MDNKKPSREELLRLTRERLSRQRRQKFSEDRELRHARQIELVRFGMITLEDEQTKGICLAFEDGDQKSYMWPCFSPGEFDSMLEKLKLSASKTWYTGDELSPEIVEMRTEFEVLSGNDARLATLLEAWRSAGAGKLDQLRGTIVALLQTIDRLETNNDG